MKRLFAAMLCLCLLAGCGGMSSTGDTCGTKDDPAAGTEKVEPAGETFRIIQEQPENLDALMTQFVDIQSDIHRHTSKQMGRLKDKLNAQISSLRDELDASTRYELHVRLENMKPHTKITHGDFNPTNVLIGEDGKVYILDWAHAAIGNASADAAMTYLQFALEDQKKADLYLKLFCKKNDIAMQYVQRWLPIVAAAQMTKKHGAEKEFLTGWTQVVEFE